MSDKVVRDDSEMKHRAINGLMAGAGAFAITSLNCYRISQEMYYEPDFGKVAQVSGIVALITGFIWFLMPGAANPPKENVAEVKNAITAPIKVALNRLLNSQKNAAVEMQEARKKYYSSVNTTSPGGWTRVGVSTENSSSYMRGYTKGASVFDNSFTDDYVVDPMTEEELEEFYSQLDQDDI